LPVADCGLIVLDRLWVFNPQSEIRNPGPGTQAGVRDAQSEEVDLEKLGISLGLLVSQLVNFTLLAVLLYLLLYKPVLRMLNQRKERISRSMADADAAREAAAQAQQEYDRRVTDAQRKAQEIIAQAAQTGEQAGAEIKAAAQREADTIRQQAREDAAQEKAQLLADVQKQIANLSMLAAERVLGQALDPDLQRKLIDQFLAEMGGNGSTAGEAES
jgi:F-type H+-transporting ATPase subunit b